VLDLGTGDGVLLALLKSRWPDVEAVGIDFSAAMLDPARARFAVDAGVTSVPPAMPGRDRRVSR